MSDDQRCVIVGSYQIVTAVIIDLRDNRINDIVQVAAVSGIDELTVGRCFGAVGYFNLP